jgi:Rrf2 family protein
MISKKTINAIELCVLLASQRAGDYLTTAELAPRLDLSISYLENILKPLKDNDIVLSMKGPGGGYTLCGDAAMVTVWDVACVFEKTMLDPEMPAEGPTHESYVLELEQVVIKTLKSFTLSDFADFSASVSKSYADTMGRFKFKPLPMALTPKAPNSVFQLGMSFQ